MQPNRHRIQRQVIELGIAGGVTSSAVQESLGRAFQEELVPELTAVFDRVANARQLLRLDRLEVDLGTIVASDWQAELRRRLGIELAQELARYSPESTHSAPGVSSHEHEPLRVFLFFLEHGRIPWWGDRPASGWREYLRDVALDGPALRSLLRDDLRARARFVDSLDPGALGAAIERWGGVPHAAQAIEWLERRARRVRAPSGWRRQSWLRLFDAALDGSLPARGPGLLGELLILGTVISPDGALPESSAAAAEEPFLDEDVSSPGNAQELPAPWREWWLRARDAAAAHSRGSAPPSRERTGALRPASSAPHAVDARRPPAASKQADDAIYLSGAGVILLHPFLETLFRDRGLLAKRDFHDEAARERAVHLLGRLAFGCREVPEFDLVTAKLLCGYPLDRPPAPAALDDADVAACDEVLAAVLGHWTALRSSSADWLRAQFFLREGKLERVDEGFRLTIERHAQDVLLAKLPWGLGVIGFPWMQEKIFVHWLD